MAVFAPWAAQAQETLTVHDGTATNSYVPIYGLWADAYLKCEMVYPASELSDMEGGTIAKMTYYATTPATAAWTGTFQVFMKEVPDASISSFYGTDGATIVYEGTLDGTHSAMEITFGTPYEYTGGNLLVGVYQTAKGNYKSITWAGESVTGASVQGYSSSSLSGVSASQRNFIPKTTFTYEAAASDCPKPDNFVASNVTAHTADLSWESDGFEFVLQYKKASDSNWTQKWPDANSYTLTGLAAETEYQVRVAAFHETCPTDPETGDHVHSDWREISFTTGIACQVPTAVTVGDITTNSAVVSWESEAGNYSLMLGDEVIAENITTNSYTLTSLTPSTYYTVKVKAICGGEDGESQWSSGTSFYTACDAVTTFPWSEDFESYASGNFSHPCWVNEHIEGSGAKVFQVSTSSMGGNSTHQLQLPDMAIGTLTKLVLPEMTLDGNYQFVLDVYRSTSTYNTSYPEEGIRVFASADGEIEGATEITFIPRHYQVSSGLIPAEENAGWYTYELPIGMSGNCYIILRGESQYCTSTYMDNFVVELVPTCLKPTNFAATNVTNHSATLDWTAGNEGQNAWQIAYSTTSFDPNAADFDLTTVEVIDNVEETSYTFDKTLDAYTHYYMYVRGYCGDEDYSKWVGIDFTTSQANPSPTITTVDEITPVSAVLRWTAPANCDNLESYDIYYSKTSGAPAAGADSLIQYKGIDAGFTSYILQNLTEGYWYVYMRAYHGETDGYSSWIPYYGYGFTVPEACPEPTGLTAGNPTPNSITLTWTEGAEWQYAWKVAYSTDPDFNPEDMDPETFVDVFGQQGPTITCTVNGLESETTYYFRVLGNCNSPYGDSDWTDAVSATTLVNCPVPTDLNVTVAQTSATLNWNGYSDSYTVQYRTAGGYDSEIFQGFEDGMGEWTMNNCHSNTGVSTSYGDALFRFYYTANYPQYLISPLLNGDNGGTMSFQYARYSNSYTEYFKVGYSTTTDDPEDFTWDEEVSVTNLYSTEFLEYTYTIPAGTKYVSIACTSDDAFYLFIDDITIQCGEYNEPGEWMTYGDNVQSGAVTITGLERGTKYDARVKANCSDPEEYSDIVTFTTNTVKVFSFEGEEGGNVWGDANNWEPTGAPTLDDDVEIDSDVIIPNGVVAYANSIIYGSRASITIQDGGQLVTNSNVTNVTVEKNIAGYMEGAVSGEPIVDPIESMKGSNRGDGWYFISNPLTTSVNPVDAGLITDELGNAVTPETATYDLYDWYATTEQQEWHNYRDGSFDLTYYNHPGYLYANKNNDTLVFTGTVYGSQNRISVSAYKNNNEFGAWNLLGNPFVCNAYLVDNAGEALPFYKMNAAGNDYEAVTGEAIAPVTGIFYEDPAAGAVYFTREAPVVGEKGTLNMNLRSNNKQLDNAIVRFGEGQQMGKFSFRENSSKIYMPVEGKDYAIANAANEGEMPVSFKAEKNGTYTLSFAAQEVSFGYLHLIDNMTGADVNLLETSSYTFEAKTTDYANRFKLVFATGNNSNEDSFAFYSNGNFVINNEGNATLQVVDVMGRIVKSESINGSATVSVNAATGVYMLRLINGDNVKVQKVVVR